MLNRISTTVVSPETAALDGFYKWVGAENDCEYHGMLKGYHAGFCVEMVNTQTNQLDYCSVCFVPEYESLDILLPEMDNGSLADEWNTLGISASCCRWYWKPTGRLVFRGYYKEHYDYEERDEYYTDASAEIEELWNRWVI